MIPHCIISYPRGNIWILCQPAICFGRFCWMITKKIILISVNVQGGWSLKCYMLLTFKRSIMKKIRCMKHSSTEKRALQKKTSCRSFHQYSFESHLQKTSSFEVWTSKYSISVRIPSLWTSFSLLVLFIFSLSFLSKWCVNHLFA